MPNKLLTKTFQTFYSSHTNSLSLRPGQHYGLCAMAQPSLKLWRQVLSDPFPLLQEGQIPEKDQVRGQTEGNCPEANDGIN